MKQILLFIFALLCMVAQGGWAEVQNVNIANNSVIINANGDWHITGTSTTNQITINEGVTATVTNTVEILTNSNYEYENKKIRLDAGCNYGMQPHTDFV